MSLSWRGSGVIQVGVGAVSRPRRELARGDRDLEIAPTKVATRNVSGYDSFVIRSFRHKGLARFFESGNTAGIQPAHAKRLRLILGRLHAASKPQDMNLFGLRLYELSGKRAGTWAVDVSRNWRVTFKFDGNDAEVVDYEDYH